MKGLIPPGSGKYLSIGVETAASFLLGLYGGYWIDSIWGPFPLWTTVGTLAGVALGFYNLYIRLKK
ncbi:MAG: AtpZ/AtpI family protein [Elusimicrobia bacterium]|nr:AtpZ/AtpI family protein [Elusimicrobiota bacterium]